MKNRSGNSSMFFFLAVPAGTEGQLLPSRVVTLVLTYPHNPCHLSHLGLHDFTSLPCL